MLVVAEQEAAEAQFPRLEQVAVVQVLQMTLLVQVEQ